MFFHFGLHKINIRLLSCSLFKEKEDEQCFKMSALAMYRVLPQVMELSLFVFNLPDKHDLFNIFTTLKVSISIGSSMH